MYAIDKLRAIASWADYQNEGFNLQFTTINQIERVYDYAQKNNLEFMDSEYLCSDNVTVEERREATAFLKKVLKQK